MQVQVNTDNHTEGSADLTRHVEELIEQALGRFGDRITRVEVHFSDESSSQKTGDDDKRCLMEARVAGRQPIAVSGTGSSREQACDAAVNKLEKNLTRTLDRLDDPKGRASYAGDETV